MTFLYGRRLVIHFASFVRRMDASTDRWIDTILSIDMTPYVVKPEVLWYDRPQLTPVNV